ncbi:LamG domain-containing protein [Chloroflexota bacterium]
MKKGILIIIVVLITTLVIGCSDDSNESSEIVSDYSFNGNANDDSGNDYHGIVHGASLTSDRNGNQNSAYSFDGNSNYIEISSPKEDDLDFTDALTVSIWVKLQNDDDFQAFISKEEGSGYGLSYRGESTDRMYFACHINGSYRSVEALEPAIMNEWYHIVGTYNHESGTSGEVKFYVNGVLQGTNTSGGDFDITNSPVPLLIGANPTQTGGSIFLNGVIDEVQLYRRAFNESEVLSLYNEQK